MTKLRKNTEHSRLLFAIALAINPLFVGACHGSSDQAVSPAGVVQQLNSSDVAQRKTALQELQNGINRQDQSFSKSTVLATTLRERLQKEGDQELRREVIRFVGEYKVAEAGAELKQILMTDGSPYIRAEASHSFAKIGGEESKNALKENLKSETNPIVLAATVRSLGELGDSSGANIALKQALNKRETAHARRKAVEALGYAGDQKTASQLKALAKDTSATPEVRWEATHAIDQIHLRGLNSDAQKVAFLKSRLDSKGTLYWAMQQLRTLKSREALQLLVDTARQPEKDDLVSIQRHYAKRALLALYDDGSASSKNLVESMIQSGNVSQMPK